MAPLGHHSHGTKDTDFLILLTDNILHWFWRWRFQSIALVNSLAGTKIFKIQKQPPEVFLKVSQNSTENTYARLYVIIMSRTCSRVNLHAVLAWKSRNSLLETGVVSEV